MKCIDPWLLNSRRQCPVCKRYVFPNQENSDDENSGQQRTRASTEQTPLIHSNEDNSTNEIPRNRNTPSKMSVIESITTKDCLFLGSRFVDHVDSDEDLSSSPSLTTTSQITTTEVVFERPSSNTRRYGSVQNSSITPRTVNVSADSHEDTTDNTNVHIHSVVENLSDIELTDDDSDERMHSVITESGENPAFVNDEESKTDTIQTHL
jgi:hypothetical protein